MKKLIVLFWLVPSFIFAQEYVRGIVPIFGFDEGAAVITRDSWQIVTKVSYSPIREMFRLPVLANSTREYYLGFRHSADINSCSDLSNPANPEVRFFFTYHNKGGHKFQISRVWGSANEGVVQWVQIPESEYQAIQGGVSANGSLDRWRLEARIPENCEGRQLKVFGIWLMAVDKVGGIIPPIDWADDLLAEPAEFEFSTLANTSVFKGNDSDLSILKLINNKWTSNQKISIEFWNGYNGKKHPTSKITSMMDGGGADGEALIFETQSAGQTTTSAKMIIKNDGNVGIGTIIPDAKLTVNGDIHTEEVRVDVTGALVPDYVFASDYDLMPLHQVSDYIKKNSHLPEIPSATEMEENGIKLKEMNLLLLKKIEELTLYVIELEKENKNLQAKDEKWEQEYDRQLNEILQRLNSLEE